MSIFTHTTKKKGIRHERYREDTPLLAQETHEEAVQEKPAAFQGHFLVLDEEQLKGVTGAVIDPTPLLSDQEKLHVGSNTHDRLADQHWPSTYESPAYSPPPVAKPSAVAFPELVKNVLKK